MRYGMATRRSLSPSAKVARRARTRGGSTLTDLHRGIGQKLQTLFGGEEEDDDDDDDDDDAKARPFTAP